MPPIRFGGLASGLPPNIVDQLMASERITIEKMEGKKEKARRTKIINRMIILFEVTYF